MGRKEGRHSSGYLDIYRWGCGTNIEGAGIGVGFGYYPGSEAGCRRGAPLPPKYLDQRTYLPVCVSLCRLALRSASSLSHPQIHAPCPSQSAPLHPAPKARPQSTTPSSAVPREEGRLRKKGRERSHTSVINTRQRQSHHRSLARSPAPPASLSVPSYLATPPLRIPTSPLPTSTLTNPIQSKPSCAPWLVGCVPFIGAREAPRERDESRA